MPTKTKSTYHLATQNLETLFALQKGFQYEIKNGYTCLVGANNAGKTSILMLAFRSLTDENVVSMNEICFITPDRFYVDSSGETQGFTLESYNNELKNNMMSGYSSVGVPPNKANLAKILLDADSPIRQTEMLNELISRLGFQEIDYRRGHSPYTGTINHYLNGSGSRTVYSIIAAITDPNVKIILIDEPEISLEPKVQRILKNILMETSKNKVILVTTHSHLFLDTANPENNESVIKNGGHVSVKPLDTQGLYETVFDLLGNSTEDLFFPGNFIITEGVSDQIVIEKILEIKSVPKMKIKVFSAKGIDNAGKVFSSITSVLTPLVLPESPYKQKIVVVTDKFKNERNRQKLAGELGDRFIELAHDSLEEYLPESLYNLAGRNKQNDLQSLADSKNNLVEHTTLKKEISKAIANVLDESNIDTLPELLGAVDLAVGLA